MQHYIHLYATNFSYRQPTSIHSQSWITHFSLVRGQVVTDSFLVLCDSTSGHHLHHHQFFSQNRQTFKNKFSQTCSHFFLTLFNRKIDYSAIGHSNTTATTSAFTEVDVKDVTRYAKTPNAAGILGT